MLRVRRRVFDHRTQNLKQNQGKSNVFYTIRGYSARLLCVALCCATPPVLADFPERLIHAIVPFTTGGMNDNTGRMIAPYLGKILGQNLIIENRPGAAGNIGIERLVKSAPDGHTILFGASSTTQNPALFRNLPYDPINDIQPVAAIIEAPYVIAVNAHLPVKNTLELIKLARDHPGKLNASAGGIGNRLSVEMFRIQNKLNVEIVSYNGTGPAAVGVATGEAQFAITDPSGFLAYVQSGRVRLIAVAGDKRLPAIPDVPTTTEAGVPEFKVGALLGVYVPAKTPLEIVQKLNATINALIVMPEVRERIQRLGGNPAPMTVEKFTQWYRREVQMWKDIVARANIQPMD